MTNELEKHPQVKCKTGSNDEPVSHSDSESTSDSEFGFDFDSTSECESGSQSSLSLSLSLTRAPFPEFHWTTEVPPTPPTVGGGRPKNLPFKDFAHFLLRL